MINKKASSIALIIIALIDIFVVSFTILWIIPKHTFSGWEVFWLGTGLAYVYLCLAIGVDGLAGKKIFQNLHIPFRLGKGNGDRFGELEKGDTPNARNR